MSRAAGVGLDLGEQRGCGLILPEPGAHQGGRSQTRDDELRVLGLPGRGLEPLDHLGALGGLSAQGVDQGLRGADPDEVEHVPARLQARDHLGGDLERLIVLTRIDEDVERALR